ncbi:RICIN domain-containing protein [Undibacterium sp. TS12]|uniref:RICIN domain-containing protein n=1 Tax=Undibacterium sp. TS12 TaxID=2908202 RepID=UPI001F4C78B1|nr:RICIN domain-containing protein [Undibacterium sp. TS12]MCH8622363.1 RICIN domain-containing protein [Undibacterium sp. TS12]
MSFNFERNRSYFIIPKHSDRPLGVEKHDRHRGLKIEQQDAYTNNPGQQIRFADNGHGHHYMVMRNSGMYWDIKDKSTDAGAQLIQWDWSDAQGHGANQRFRLMSNGDGYHYIKSVHSGLMLEVKDGGKAWENVQQNKLKDKVEERGHQLFRVIPASDEYLASDQKSFKEYSDLLRTATLALIGKIPEAGGAIQAVLGFLWPDKHDQDFWNQITAYVEQRMKDLLEEAKLTAMKEILEGTRDNLNEYLKSGAANKRSKLVATITSAQQNEKPYLKAQAGVAVLPLLVAWGTLMLTARLEMVRYYDDKLAGKSDDNPNETQSELQFLKEAIERYGNAAKECREKAMKWRLGFLHNDVKITNSREWGRIEDYWVEDRFDGWRKEARFAPATRVSDPEAKDRIKNARDMREAQIRAKFDAELDVVMAAERLWPYFDPEKAGKAAKKKIQVVVGSFGDRPRDKKFDCGSGGLIEIKLCTFSTGRPHASLCGLQLRYANGTQSSYGNSGDRQETLTLTAGEFITNVRGLQRNSVEGLMIETSHGRSVHAGQLGEHFDRNYYFDAGLDDMVGARLVGISGSYSDNSFHTLSFHWEYERTE